MLGVPAASVDHDADLIAQGLDSIRMMALAGRWRRQGIEVDFARLAAAPSIRAWVNLIESAHVDSANLPPAEMPTNSNVQPFPLAPMQHALWIGRHDNQSLGGVSAHLYVEFDGGRVDPATLTWAATRLVERHPMLRVQFLPDGTQCIGEPAGFSVTVEDLSGYDDTAVESRLAAIRETKSHQQLDDAVLELSLTLLPGDRSRLHVDLDMQAADAMSYRTLLHDLAVLYGGRVLPELRYTYREYLANIEQVRQSTHQRDRRWWSARVPELPDPPALPLSASVAVATPKVSGEVHGTHGRDMRRSTRRWHWLDPAARDALYDSAHRRGLTPATALAASFAHTVAGWSADPHFLLNVPLFGRESLHQDVPKLVGDFTTSLLLDVDLVNADTAAQRASAMQTQMHTAAGHAAYPGLSVLRDLSRRRGAQVLAPVVFTSALGLGELFSTDVTSQFGRPVWMISQGPQVLLDAQVTEFDGGVLINWDVREHMFAPGVIDAMFTHHIDEVKRLAAGDVAWDEPDGALVPVTQQRVRETANSVAAPRSPETLYSRFVANAEHQPDAPAVLSSDGQWTYAQLLIRARSVAAALQARGMQPGDTVAVLGPKCAEQIPALLGIVLAG
ncbi:MAG: condensation domain-containing protein, partial [Mycobacterium sp.]